LHGRADSTGYAPPPFRARPPWWGGDLQTLRNTVARAVGFDRFDLPGMTLTLPVSDGSGDRLIGVLNDGRGRERRPLAMLVHGLTGCHESGYMVASARRLIGLGHPVLRLNLRGAGPSAGTCRERYHAGRGRDIADAIRALPEELTRDGIVLVGYSLGANILLNFLAIDAAGLPVRAAATVSAPIDLAASARRILAPRNHFYQRYLLNRMRRDWAGAALSESERLSLREVRTIYAFDDRLVAPRNGFGTAERYYAECSGLRVLGRIGVPTLLIHAADDPWIPVAAYRDYDWTRNERLTPLIVPGGGHVGFHDSLGPPAWHDRRIGDYFAASLRAISSAA